MNCQNLDVAEGPTPRRTALLIATGLAVAIATVTCQQVTADASATVPNIHDSMQRKVSAGWGSAPVGGAWRATPARAFAVTPGAARIGPVSPGQSAAVVATGVSVVNETLEARFALPALTKTGDGTYVGLQLRRQTGGDEYRAKVRIRPNGLLSLGLSRVEGTVETALTRSINLPVAVRARQIVDLTASVSGTQAVSVSAQVVTGGHTGSVAYQDRSAKRVAAAGAFGVWVYDPRNAATSTQVVVSQVSGVGAVSARQASSAPSPAPTSSAPSPAPTSSAPSPAPTSSGTASTAGSSSTTTAGSDTPGTDTSYSVPQNALYVDPAAGSDSYPGSVTAPFATLAHAVAVATTNSTIVLRGGTYHENVTVPAKKTLTIEAYPGEAVWFDGSVPVTTWSPTSNGNGTAWADPNWYAQFDSTAGYSTSSAAAMNWLTPAYPMAAHPDQAYLDGVALNQVSSLSAVGPGSFYVDYSAHTLYIGSDPTGHAVRASDLAQAITVNSPGSILRGFGVQRFATSVPQMGTVSLDGNNDSADNLIVSDNATQGLHIGGTGITADHITATNNGLLGIHANYADGLVISNSLVLDNNSQHFNTSPVAGGIKITRTRGIIVTNTVSEDNDGNGLWFDESCYDMTATGNTLSDNTRMGLSVELSALGIYSDNTLTDNAYDGIRVTDTSNLQIWNNTFDSNQSRNIELVQDTRTNTPSTPGHDPRQADPDPTISWVTANVQVEDNVFIAGGQFHVYAFDSTGKRTASQMQLTVDGNVFSAPPRQGYAPFGWGTAGGTLTRYTLDGYTAATGDGTNNTMSSGQNSVAMQSQVNDDANALPLPGAVATAIGEPAGTQHHGTF